MPEKICIQCGSALTKAGAKFCTTCGTTVDDAETADVSSKETRPLPGEKTDPASFATEVFPVSKPPSYATEEMPQVVITARAEERATEAITNAPVTQSQTKRAEPEPAKQPSVQHSAGQSAGQSGGRKRLALAAVLGVVALVALAAASFFFVNWRRASEAQAGTQTANNAEPATSPQPTAQPSSPQPDQQPNQQPDQQLGQQPNAGANNQSQPQTRPQPGPSISEVKSPAVRNDAAASKPQQQAAAKPTPEPTGISADEHKGQGITYMNSGRYQEALREYEYVKKLDPGNKDVYYLIGQTYHKMNQLGQALEAYRQCTSGQYASVAQDAVKKLEKKVGKVNAK
jgi:predicted Zn-dependent protease